MPALSVIDVTSFKPPKAELSSQSLAIAANALQQLWDEHQKSRFIKPDGSRVRSSLFGALLAREIFGGTLAGNGDHIFVLLGDIIVDLNQAQPDVKALDALAHINIPGVIAQESFREKLGLHLPKAQTWAQFAIEKISAPAVRRHLSRDDSTSLSM